MAKRIRNFVDRAFSRTVNLDQLHRLLQPHLAQIDFDWPGLPEDERKKREAIFELFAKADAKFPPSLQFALYNISTLAWRCCVTRAGGKGAPFPVRLRSRERFWRCRGPGSDSSGRL